MHIHIHNMKIVLLTTLSVNLVTFITFTMLCNHHHYLFLKLFYHSKEKLCNHYRVTPILPILQPLVTANLLFESMNFPTLDISHK